MYKECKVEKGVLGKYVYSMGVVVGMWNLCNVSHDFFKLISVRTKCNESNKCTKQT